MAGQCLMQEIALYELFFFSLLKTGSFGIVRKKLNIPNPSHSIIAWMALNSGLQQIELADFIPTNTVTLCGMCMLEDESANQYGS
ncbi:unnamed protein product, partial [Arabidopsis halleri]